MERISNRSKWWSIPVFELINWEEIPKDATSSSRFQLGRCYHPRWFNINFSHFCRQWKHHCTPTNNGNLYLCNCHASQWWIFLCLRPQLAWKWRWNLSDQYWLYNRRTRSPFFAIYNKKCCWYATFSRWSLSSRERITRSHRLCLLYSLQMVIYRVWSFGGDENVIWQILS